jgi:AcrR family transcriptional regulator
MPKVSNEYLKAQREKILDAAMMCFARKGFTETTILDICHEAKLSTGAIYRYFKNKNEIIEASVQKHRTERSKRLTPIEEKKNAHEMLDELYQFQMHRMLSPEPDSRAKIMIHAYGEALMNAHVSTIVNQNWDEMNTRFEKIIQKAQKQGYINPALEAHAVAVLMNALHDGLLLLKVIAPDSRQILEKVLRLTKALFMTPKGLEARDKPREG